MRALEADRPGRAPTGAERGLTIVELVITATLLVAMMLAVTALMLSGSSAAKLAERSGRALEIAQELADGVRTELRSSVRIFGNDPAGLAYRSRLESWAEVPVLTTSVPPTLVVDDTFKKDVAGAAKTGNELCFARHAWSAEFRVPTGTVYRYDVYRLVRYYLSPVGGGPRPGTATGLNLVKWVGEPMVDGTQIDGITTPGHQPQVLAHLLGGTADLQGVSHPKVSVAWKLGQDPAVAGTFRQILPTGVLTSTPQAPRSAPWTVLRDPTRCSAGLLSYRHHSIATNYSLPSYGVPKFALADNTGLGYPHGFEVQWIGPSSARQILLHVVIVSTNNAGHRAHAGTQAVLAARDL